jgi:hypothetical protein
MFHQCGKFVNNIFYVALSTLSNNLHNVFTKSTQNKVNLRDYYSVYQVKSLARYLRHIFITTY